MIPRSATARIERGPPIPQQRRIGEDREGLVPEPANVGRRLHRPGEKARIPEVVHELTGGRRHAIAAQDDREQRGRSQNGIVTRNTRPSARSRESSHRTANARPIPAITRTEACENRTIDQPGQPGEHQPPGGGVPSPEIERDEEQEDRGGRVHRVLLHLRAVPAERDPDGEEADRERHSPPIERALREAAEEQSTDDAAEKRKEPERELASAEDAAWRVRSTRRNPGARPDRAGAVWSADRQAAGRRCCGRARISSSQSDGFAAYAHTRSATPRRTRPVSRRRIQRGDVARNLRSA